MLVQHGAIQELLNYTLHLGTRQTRSLTHGVISMLTKDNLEATCLLTSLLEASSLPEEEQKKNTFPKLNSLVANSLNKKPGKGSVLYATPRFPGCGLVYR